MEMFIRIPAQITMLNVRTDSFENLVQLQKVQNVSTAIRLMRLIAPLLTVLLRAFNAQMRTESFTLTHALLIMLNVIMDSTPLLEKLLREHVVSEASKY